MYPECMCCYISLHLLRWKHLPQPAWHHTSALQPPLQQPQVRPKYTSVTATAMAACRVDLHNSHISMRPCTTGMSAGHVDLHNKHLSMTTCTTGISAVSCGPAQQASQPAMLTCTIGIPVLSKQGADGLGAIGLSRASHNPCVPASTFHVLSSQGASLVQALADGQA